MSCTSLLSSAVLALTALALGAGCNPNASAQEVVDKSAPAICKKTQECNPTGFGLTYPGGVDECTSKTKTAVSAKYGGDLDKSSTCTDDEVDTCLEQFSSAACGANGAVPPVPCGC